MNVANRYASVKAETCRRGRKRVGVSALGRVGVGGSVSAWAQACRRGRKRVGVSACRRVGMSGFSRRLDYPAVGMINHFDDLRQNLVAGVIKFLEDLLSIGNCFVNSKTLNTSDIAP
jgi:hypothetical protein